MCLLLAPLPVLYIVHRGESPFFMHSNCISTKVLPEALVQLDYGIDIQQISSG